MFIQQTDLWMAYIQCVNPNKNVFVTLPEFWSKFVDPKYSDYFGKPVRMAKCLYGFFKSSLSLWEEEAALFKSFGLHPCEKAPALWYKHFDDGVVLLVLQHFVRKQRSTSLKSFFSMHSRVG